MNEGAVCSHHEKMQFQITNLYTMMDDVLGRLEKLESGQATVVTNGAVMTTQLVGIKDVLTRIETSIQKEFKQLDAKLDALDKRVKDLEDHPKNMGSAIMVGVVSAVVSGIVVWVVTRGGV